MKVIFRNEMLILVPVEPEESSALTRWKADHRGHSFILATDQGSGLMLRDLGDPRLNQPINVTSRHPSKTIQLIGNFADTPFELDGQRYCSVESFWQSLKCRCESDRQRIAALPGPGAKLAAREFPNTESFQYCGAEILVGSFAHWDLMQRASRAKFEQNPRALAALVSTFPHPLVHRLKGDSRTIPGDVMARIWLGLRHQYCQAQLAAQAEQ